MFAMLENEYRDVFAVNPMLVAAIMGGGNYGDGIARSVIRFASGSSLEVRGTVREVADKLNEIYEEATYGRLAR